MLPFDSIPTSIRRCIHYFIFTTAAIIVAVGLLIMQRKKGKVGDYIVVTGVVVLMIGILLLSKEYRGRGAPSLPTRTQASTEQQSQPPRNDPPPSYSDTWRESYLQDQEKKAELDPPPPAYRESWSKGLWKKYFQSGRIGCDNHLCELNASTLPQDVENTASLPTPKPDNVSQDPSSLQENECAPPITPVLVPPAGEGSQTSAVSSENRAPGLERRASFASTSTASESSERVRHRSCSVTQLSSMFENTPVQGPELPTISRGDGGASIIEPSEFVYVYESGRHWVVDN